MNIVNTKELLSTYVLETLGQPVITVEITPSQLSNCIDNAVQKFSDFAMGGDTPQIYMLDLVKGVNTYIMDERVQAITRVRSVGNSFSFSIGGGMIITPSEICAQSITPMGSFDLANMSAVLAQISTLEKLFDVEPNWNYNGNSKQLVFYDNTANISSKVILETYISYRPNDIDMIYNHQWVKDYSVALAKKQWGNNIGKINAPLINGGTLNYDRLLQEAQNEIEKLDQELLTKWSQPLGIYRA